MLTTTCPYCEYYKLDSNHCETCECDVGVAGVGDENVSGTTKISNVLPKDYMHTDCPTDVNDCTVGCQKHSYTNSCMTCKCIAVSKITVDKYWSRNDLDKKGNDSDLTTKVTSEAAQNTTIVI